MENLDGSERMQNIVTETTIFLINYIRAECGEGGGMFRVSINCVLFNTFGEILTLMPQLFKRFLLDFEWFLYCVLLYHKTCYFYINRQELFLMYSCRALAMQWYFTVSRPSSFVGLKLKMFYLSVFCTSVSHLGSPIAAPGDVSNVHHVQWQHAWLH